MRINFCLRLVWLIAIVIGMTGCVESSFILAPESRLPKWFDVPEGMSINEIKVTMDYYTDGSAVFKLYKKEDFFYLKKVTGITHSARPLKLKSPPSGFSKHYPAYEVITVEGITDIIEHRKMEPIFYVIDDPAIWKEFGIEKK